MKRCTEFLSSVLLSFSAEFQVKIIKIKFKIGSEGVWNIDERFVCGSNVSENESEHFSGEKRDRSERQSKEKIEETTNFDSRKHFPSFASLFLRLPVCLCAVRNEKREKKWIKMGEMNARATCE